MGDSADGRVLYLYAKMLSSLGICFSSRMLICCSQGFLAMDSRGARVSLASQVNKNATRVSCISMGEWCVELYAEIKRNLAPPVPALKVVVR